jgi:hypothetical protein
MAKAKLTRNELVRELASLSAKALSHFSPEEQNRRIAAVEKIVANLRKKSKASTRRARAARPARTQVSSLRSRTQ